MENNAASTSNQQQTRKRVFKKFKFRGIELEKLLDMSNEQLMDLFNSKVRRKFRRGLGHKYLDFIRKIRKAKQRVSKDEKPRLVKTHLRDMVILPEMIGSIIGVYNGMTFTEVEIKPEMIGHKLGEFSLTYKPVKHGKPGIGATHSSKFVPLK